MLVLTGFRVPSPCARRSKLHLLSPAATAPASSCREIEVASDAHCQAGCDSETIVEVGTYESAKVRSESRARVFLGVVEWV